MKRLIIYIICLSGLIFSGCAFTSPELTHEYVDHGIKAIDRSTEMQLAIAQANPALDPVKVAEAATSFKEQRESIDKAFNEIRKEIAEEKRQREAIFSAIAGIAIEALPAGAAAIKVANGLQQKIDTAKDAALQAANERTKEVGNDLAEARSKFDNLSTSLQEKLGKVPENLIEDLAKLKADDAAFRESFQGVTKLTDAEMESLKGLSTKELIGLLVAAITGTSAGGALGKTGKSRGSKEIEALRAELTGKSGIKDIEKLRAELWSERTELWKDLDEAWDELYKTNERIFTRDSGNTRKPTRRATRNVKPTEGE